MVDKVKKVMLPFKDESTDREANTFPSKLKFLKLGRRFFKNLMAPHEVIF